jgi:hypothetical protein
MLRPQASILEGTGFFVAWHCPMSVVSASFWHAAGTDVAPRTGQRVPRANSVKPSLTFCHTIFM